MVKWKRKTGKIKSIGVEIKTSESIQTYYNMSLNKIRFLLSLDFENEIEKIFKLFNTKDIALLLKKNT